MLPIKYDNRYCSHGQYVEARDIIANDFSKWDMSAVVEKINNTFFHGGVFSGKSFEILGSMEMPKQPSKLDTSSGLVRFEEQTSISAVLGYIETIPVFGSFLAVVNTIGHLFFMCISYLALWSAVRSLERDSNVPVDSKILDAATAYTVHRNHLLGSLLSIIPLAKPLVRLGQGFYHEYVVEAKKLARA